MPRRAPSDLQALDQQLCFALYSASLAMTKVYQPLLDPLGVTYPQYLVLLVLWEHEGLSVSEIGERLMLESSTLTPLLKRLETAGLVRRQRDTMDERRVLVHLSARGRNLKTKATAVPKAVACATACDVSDIALLTAELKTLRANLTESLSGTTNPSNKGTSSWPSKKPSIPPTPRQPGAAPAPPSHRMARSS